MTSRNLARRLERLEEELIPEDDPKSWEIIIVDSDSTRTPNGIRIDMPRGGRAKGHVEEP
jgi:hypothetical protein